MKKIFAILLIVVLLAGCTTTSFLCTGKQAVLDGLQFIINQSNSVITEIKTQYPGLIPAAVQNVLDAAQKAHDAAQAASDKVCPTTADLTTVQGQMAQANQMMFAAMKTGTMKIGK